MFANRYVPRALVLVSLLVLAVSAYADGFYIRPHLQNITPDGATVIWETQDTGVGTVAYGENYARQAAEQQPAKIHKVRLTGLAPETMCPYRVVAGDQTHEAAFKTAPGADRPITFVAMGDSRRWATTWQDTKMGEHMMQWKPEFVFNNGDLVLDGHKYELWPEHFQRFGSFNDKLMMFSIRGNHEGSRTKDTDTDWFAKYHELPGGEPISSFDWGNTHFVSVSMDYLSDCAKELDDDLAKTTKKHTVVLFHPPVYCTGYWGPDASRKEEGEAFAKALDVIDKHHVSLHLAGHTHIYERKYPIRGGKRDASGTTYVIQGGDINAGYPDQFSAFTDDRENFSKPTYTLIQCGDDRINVRTFAWSTKENNVGEIDHFTIWRDESAPKAALAEIDGKTGAELCSAIEAVGAMMYEPAVPALADKIKDSDAAVRRAAAKALRSIGNQAAVEALLPLVKDSDPAVAREAARTVEIAMPENMAKAVAGLAADALVDEQARASLVGALQLHTPAADARKVAAALLEDEQTPAKVRMRAAYALKYVTEDKDVKLLVKLVKNEVDKFALVCLAARLNELTKTRVGIKDDQPLVQSAPGQRDEFVKQWLGK